MLKRRVATWVTGIVTCAASMSGVSEVPAAAALPKPRVTVSASAAEVVEGDVLRLTAKVARARSASRAVLERWEVPESSFWDPSWERVKTVRAKSRLRFSLTATEENSLRYRVSVRYKGVKKPVISKPVTVKVWRWIPLSQFSSYYSTGQSGFATAALNGKTYNAWGAWSYSNARSWEDRFTPGRNCKAFKGLVGIGDASADGSSGTVSLLADEAAVWQSPVLTPGMTVPLEVPLSLPYRLAIQAANTSAAGVRSYPVIGDPALLCTGI